MSAIHKIQPTAGKRLARAEKQAEIIAKMNPLLNMQVSGGVVRYSRGGVMISIPSLDRIGEVWQPRPAFSSSVTVAGADPTLTEIRDAIIAAYPAGTIPQEMDVWTATNIPYHYMATYAAIDTTFPERLSTTFFSLPVYWHMIHGPPGEGGGGVSARAPFGSSLTKAGLIPTTGEIQTAMRSAYSAASATPQEGDYWYATNHPYHYRISENSLGSSGIFRFDVEIPAASGNYFGAMNIGPNSHV